MLRVPVYLPVTVNKLLFYRSGPDIPGLLGIIEQRCFTAPAEGIGMVNRLTAKEQPSCPQVIQNKRVSFLDKPAREGVAAGNLPL